MSFQLKLNQAIIIPHPDLPQNQVILLQRIAPLGPYHYQAKVIPLQAAPLEDHLNSVPGRVCWGETPEAALAAAITDYHRC